LTLTISLGCFSLVNAVSAAQTDDGAVEYGGHSYKVYENGLDWNSAESYCENLGGHLVVISNGAEQNFVESLISNGSRNGYWIGAYREDDSSDYYWVDGTNVNDGYNNWGDTQPDFGSENAVMMYKYPNPNTAGNGFGKWNDLDSNGENANTYPKSKMGFVCEWDYVDKTINETKNSKEEVKFEEKNSSWATKEMEEAYENNLIPDILLDDDLTEPITRAEFASVALKLYEALEDSKIDYNVSTPFTDVSNISNYKDIKNAYAIGIAVGTAPDKFEPNTQINREQLVTML
jgi:hypothetical protein